jgi:hypothetical protein
VERPDAKPEALGLKQLDEPAAVQSDPTVLDLQLRAVSKTATLEPMTVRVLAWWAGVFVGVRAWVGRWHGGVLAWLEFNGIR